MLKSSRVLQKIDIGRQIVPVLIESAPDLTIVREVVLLSRTVINGVSLLGTERIAPF